ncbi:MAG: beta-ACP synthase [Prevotellaceae bacterium]|jgi:3-oxoacyl-(acyl-carrier-protein) synthase|nr:beta-ACP synthase [Prevotellaceae bacterium]
MGNNLNIHIPADNIISSLGFTTQQNIDAIYAYRSGVMLDESKAIADQPIQAAKICSETLGKYINHFNLVAYTKAEQLIILSVNELLQQYDVDLSATDSAFIISTTKGNIDVLQNKTHPIPESAFLWKMAEKISNYYSLENRISVVSNACISGISALIAAKRLLQAGIYRNIVVVGFDVLSHFITSGFISFKSVSSNICRPYDKKRDGLNLGEACGSVLLTTDYCPNTAILYGGAITNDANHISGPSKTGDGLHYAIQGALEDAGLTAKDMGYVNLHGTATVYNDEMEAKAIHWSQLQNAKVNSLKPYIGHTLGASGIVESILSVHQLKAGIVFGTLGYENNGVSQSLNVSSRHQEIAIRTCVKTGSGFGGCNAAIVLSIENKTKKTLNKIPITISSIKNCMVENSTIIVNNNLVFKTDTIDFPSFIRNAYKNLGESNMKFYKMDDLAKLGYIAAAYLLKDELKIEPLNIGIILSNSAASLDTDRKYQQQIDKDGDAAGSPSVFVYTLPNVATGEICIHHKIQGENTFFIEKNYSPEKLKTYAQLAMQDSGISYCICGWCEFINGIYKAEFELLKTK